MSVLTIQNLVRAVATQANHWSANAREVIGDISGEAEKQSINLGNQTFSKQEQMSDGVVLFSAADGSTVEIDTINKTAKQRLPSGSQTNKQKPQFSVNEIENIITRALEAYGVKVSSLTPEQARRITAAAGEMVGYAEQRLLLEAGAVATSIRRELEAHAEYSYAEHAKEEEKKRKEIEQEEGRLTSLGESALKATEKSDSLIEGVAGFVALDIAVSTITMMKDLYNERTAARQSKLDEIMAKMSEGQNDIHSRITDRDLNEKILGLKLQQARDALLVLGQTQEELDGMAANLSHMKEQAVVQAQDAGVKVNTYEELLATTIQQTQLLEQLQILARWEEELRQREAEQNTERKAASKNSNIAVVILAEDIRSFDITKLRKVSAEEVRDYSAPSRSWAARAEEEVGGLDKGRSL